MGAVIVGCDTEDENRPGTRIEMVSGTVLAEVLVLVNKQLAKGWRTWLANQQTVTMGRDWVTGNIRTEDVVHTVTLMFARPDPTREWNGDNFAAVVADGLRDLIPDETARRTRSQNIALAVLEKFFSGKR